MATPKSFQIFFFLSLSVIVSCKNDSGSVDQNNKAGKEVAITPSGPPEAGSNNGDTLNISGKFVLFFGPVEMADSTQKFTESELKSFKETGFNLIDSLSGMNDIKAIYSTAPVFRVFSLNGNVMIISKSGLNEEAGMLLSDGNQPPTIKKGILSQGDYFELIKKYFFLK